jgi:hypothetical protein
LGSEDNNIFTPSRISCSSSINAILIWEFIVWNFYN